MAEYSIDELINNIYVKIDKYSKDKKFKKKLIEDFVNKGLYEEVVLQAFEGGLDISKLSKDTELICLAKGIHEYISNKYEDNDLSITKYFSSQEIMDYETKVIIKDETSNIVVFKNATRINKKTYIAYVTAEQLSLMREHRNYQNFQGIQRPRVPVKTKIGEYEKIDTNEKGIEDLKTRFINRDIFPTAIAFSVLDIEGKNMRLNFVKKTVVETKNKTKNKTKDENKNQQDTIGEFGDLYIETNFNYDDENYTPLIIPDGYHRFTAMADAYDECIRNKTKLETGLFVIIGVMTQNEAKQYVVDAFKRNDVSEKNREGLNAITPSNANKFVNEVVKSSNILNDNVVDSYYKIKELNKLTSQTILEESVELSDFKIDDEITSEFQAEKSGNMIDLLINHMLTSYFEDDFEKMKKTYLLSPYMFTGYISIANKLIKNPNYKKIIMKLGEELYLRLDNSDIVELNLNHKKCDINKVFDYFNSLIGGIINE